MRCPICHYEDSKVLDSRPAHDGREIRRRRECLRCRRRFTSYERIEEIPLWVIKKSGQREIFESSKIIRGVLTACEKRPIPLDTIKSMVEQVEREIRDQFVGEVPSRDIGEWVMARLRQLDEVAYVRFASVYRQFTDIEGFRKELEQLLNNTRTS